jgi:alkanesulfonate monooxygenase SsuD/methylene tetrahydromethanopterin reductase-like flavin-dependent oxidoreductase (luciferase family)
MTRIKADDLRDAERKARAARADGAASVYLDIEVLIDTDVASAFRSADGRPPGRLCYIGTPRGLAGLIADVQRLGIADGVVLVTADEDRVSRLMLDEMSPGLGLQACSPSA